MTEDRMERAAALRKPSTWTGFFALMVAALSGAATATPAAPTPEPAQTAPVVKTHWYQIGRASWYGGGFQGRATASGEAYNMADLTCAHRSLPLGTLVRVTNLTNNRSVVVRVNDRGPYFANRVVDLSYAAARFLGFSRAGTQTVRLDVLKSASELAAIQSSLAFAGR